MSAVSSRPPIPRPAARASIVPSSSSLLPPAPSSVRPVQAVPTVAVQAASPPVEIRERMPTLELADDDLVVEEPVVRARSTPPPPPVRSAVVPKMQGLVMPKIALQLSKTPAVEAAPVSAVQLRPAPVQAFAPVQSLAPVQTFDPMKTKLESMLDPSESLFDGMYELNYADSQWQAARLCAAALGRALGARTVIIHAHDLVSRELRAIGVHGDGEFDVLGMADASDEDLVASAVICNEKPVTMRFDGELPRLAPKRLEIIGAPRTLVAVPAMAWGRCVAVIEIIDADERLASRVADSAAYVAERLAEFLSSRAAA